MPYIQAEIDSATAEQKQKLVEGFTKVASDVLSADPSAFYVLIKENPTDNWGVGGKVLTQLLKESKQ